ncbi:hypothetical protein BMS3Abin02_01024 [bacterium BMS3Abin02]|nr:hypothetical protein BMS3Abin02_01024 [bacterium BMS3Abin02]GBE23626.1 hypothetical protein BMS3Bbin01_03011 [bacterium BMS3Bbin01]
MRPLYEQIDATTFRSTELTTGPWSPDAQHGGPPAALMAHAMESVGTPAMFTARFTAEFLRPVPIAEIEATAAVVRTGRRVEIVTASLAVDGTPVAAAHALRIRRHEGLDLPPVPAVAPSRLPDECTSGVGFTWDSVSFVTDALDVRFIEGSMTQIGPATAWIRLMPNVVDEQPPTPLQRVLVAADCGNGISSIVNWRQFLYINPDLTAYLHREPAGEWVLMHSNTILQPHGVGLAQSSLYDEQGPLGRSLQSLYVGQV